MRNNSSCYTQLEINWVERGFQSGIYNVYYNEVFCIRTLVRIAIFHSQLYFTTSIRILLKQTIIEHQLSLLSGLSTGVYSLYSSRLLLMITFMIVEISKSSAETKLLVGVRCRDGPQPLTKQRVWTLCKLNLRYCLPRVLDMYLFIYFLVADTDSITKSVTMYSFWVLSGTSLFATREFLISFLMTRDTKDMR